jgi:hypothetical protein
VRLIFWHVRPEQHGEVAEHWPRLLPWQHPLVPFARVPHSTPVPVQLEQIPPPEPQLEVVVPALQMPPDAQQPSGQEAAPQALASHRQVVVLKVDPVPQALLTHCSLPVVPHSTVPVGHTHWQLALRTRPPEHSAKHCPPVPVPPGSQKTRFAPHDASHRQVAGLKVDPAPHWLLTHWLLQTVVLAGHTQLQVAGSRTRPPEHSAKHCPPVSGSSADGLQKTWFAPHVFDASHRQVAGLNVDVALQSVTSTHLGLPPPVGVQRL